MRFKIIAISVLALAALIGLSSSYYILDETEQAIILQFGKPVGEPIRDAGLHFKVPFVQQVTRFEKRLLEWDGDPNQIPTSDKKYIWVNTFARWRIVDPLKFYQSVRDERYAQSRLDDIIDGVTRDFITENPLIDVVRNSNREMATTAEGEIELGVEGAVDTVTIGREAITREILRRVSEIVPQYGIELVDVRIKRINYIEDVRRKVYERMISERKRIAQKYRSEGQGRKAEIDGEREKELQRITSEAYRKAQQIIGEADATATEIYAQAYGRDPEFYSFLKTLETYSATLAKNSTIVLSTDSEYLKYLKEIRP
jgi:membrane protease subunit HflC